MAGTTRQFGATFEVKAATEVADGGPDGFDFSGYFSVFDNVDSDGDIIRRGAFSDSLAVRLPKILDHHGMTVGQATKAYEDEHGLFVEGRIYATAAGRDLALLMRRVETERGPAAPVEQGSIGFMVPEGGAVKLPTGETEISRIDLFEVSPVTFGANNVTRIGLKGLTIGSYDGPIDELMGEAVRMLSAATSEAKALARRRVADGRDLNAKQLDSIAELAIVSGDTLVELLAVEEKSGRTGGVTAARRRYLATVARALSDYLASLPEGDRAEVAALIEAGDGAGAADEAGKAGEPSASKAPADTETKGETDPDYRLALAVELARRRMAAMTQEQ